MHPVRGRDLRGACAILLGVILVAFLLIPSARAEFVNYGHTLGGPGSEAGVIIGVDGSGNVYQFGTTSGFTAGAFLAKRDSRGDVLWQRLLDFGGTLAPDGIAVAPDGTVYFAGQYGGNFTGATVFGKVLSDGTLGFAKVTTAFISANAIALNPVSGDVLITGATSWSPPSGGLFAIDPTGPGPLPSRRPVSEIRPDLRPLHREPDSPVDGVRGEPVPLRVLLADRLTR